MFEENQEVESSSSFTSSQTIQGGTTKTSTASRTKGTSQNVVIMPTKRDTTNISKIYHFKGASNYGMLAHRVKHMVSKDDLFTYCVTPPSSPMIVTKIITRSRILNFFTTCQESYFKVVESLF
jgi:hypothetical protein